MLHAKMVHLKAGEINYIIIIIIIFIIIILY